METFRIRVRTQGTSQQRPYVGKDGKKRGDRTMRTYICVNTCGTSTSPVDHDFKNTPDGSCTFIKQEPNN